MQSSHLSEEPSYQSAVAHRHSISKNVVDLSQQVSDKLIGDNLRRLLAVEPPEMAKLQNQDLYPEVNRVLYSLLRVIMESGVSIDHLLQEGDWLSTQKRL